VNPFDDFVEQTISQSVCCIQRTSNPTFYWSCDTAQGKVFAAQRMADAARVAYLNQQSYLCVHPAHGPWFAIRAAVVFDMEGPVDRPPMPVSPLSQQEEAAVQAALNRAIETAGTYGGSFESQDGWQVWATLRDTVHPNHPRRYCSNQLQYHYTKDLDLLESVL
jgi:methylmalonic aciduria homocystinuria type C protein